MAEPVKNFVIRAVTPPAAPPPAMTLEDEEQALLARLAQIREKKEAEQREARARIEAENARLAELQRMAELSKPVKIHATAFVGALVLIKNDWREDVLKVLQDVPGRVYRGSGENGIPVGEWERFKVAVQQLPNVELTANERVEDAIFKHLHAPVWLVELDKRNIRITPGPRYNAYVVQNVPGVTWNAERGYFSCPLSEAWRLYKALESVEGVLYTDEAKDFTIKQVEMRSSLDKIALAKDWDYPVELKNGIKLRPFQKVGCAFIEATGGNALLAYQMGLGKTFISLAYAIKNNLRTIIVCPASLKANWCREIYRLSGVQPNVLVGSSPTNHDIVSLLTSPSLFTVINYDIVGRKTEYDDVSVDAEGFKHQKHVVKYLWVEVLNMSKPDLYIFDESHYIKNTDSNRSQGCRLLKAPRILHMTGTPVLNRPGELWPMLTMLAPDTFPAEETFLKQYTYDGKYARNVDELKEALKPVMIRRKQSDVVDDMPPLNRITDYHELSPKALKIYNKVLDGIYEAIAAYSPTGHGGSESSIASILAKIQRLKMVCAIDKVDRTAELAIELHESALDDEKSKHKKVLIFSQYKAVAFAIAQRLGHEALCFVTKGKKDFVTADNVERDRLVQQFQTDDAIKYLVVTEKTAKEGHNITAAGFTIFNDLFWTPAAHEQGEGRSYMRIGDPHGIDAYYLVTDMNGDSIEEWVWQMLQSKMRVIEQTIEGVESSRNDESVAMELISKMRDMMWSMKKK